ncbi:MAG: cell division transport system permease protein [Actinomycetota bacterium]|nr:cell division transport system permease protein [Actinomycetota bacterium]
MRLGYFMSETITNLRRNFLMTIAAISTVAISLLLLGGVQILGLIVGNVTLSWEAKVEVSVFLRDDILPAEQNSLEAQITGYDEVEDVTYVSQAQAYEEFKKLYRAQPEIIQGIKPDTLPASFRVKLFDADDAAEVAGRIQGAPGVDEVKFGGEIIKRLLQVNSLLRTVTFALSLVLMIASAALIANAIRLAIYARREEIGIMKLVGATNWFIRIPFMLEGIFAALVGAVVSGVVVVAADALLFSRLASAFPFLRQAFSFTTGDIVGVLVILTGVAALVGIVGSTMALRRFLEV